MRGVNFTVYNRFYRRGVIEKLTGEDLVIFEFDSGIFKQHFISAKGIFWPQTLCKVSTDFYNKSSIANDRQFN